MLFLSGTCEEWAELEASYATLQEAWQTRNASPSEHGRLWISRSQGSAQNWGECIRGDGSTRSGMGIRSQV